ncbi:MAG: glycosyltransferase family 39 protein [Chloroflexi bacterium]|nr:glycosyltransferase family 39 protein [Chloroflexota bacterium]
MSERSSRLTRYAVRAPEHLSRMAPQLLVVLTFAYVLAPGHPLGLLTGLPLGPASLAAVVGLGALLFGLGPPPRGRLATLGVLALFLLVTAKLLLAWSAPAYGLAASYYSRARASGSIERSTEYLNAPFTRVEQYPGADGFALHFFNDVERFNYYEAPDPDRRTLPFAVRWQGYLTVPVDGDYPFRVSGRGTAVLSLDGAPRLTIGSRGGVAHDAATLPLTAGSHRIEVEFQHAGGPDPALGLDADVGDGLRSLGPPWLTRAPTESSVLLRDRLAATVARSLDLLVLTAIGVAGIAGLVCRLRVGRAHHRGALLERPLLAAFLLAVLAHALLTTRDLFGRAAILEGGQDWLTYESYAREILLNGPLMTLGKPLGEGRPFFFQPFYPYYLAGLHWLTGEGIWGPLALQLIGLGVSGVLIFYLTKRLFGIRAAVLAFVLFVVLRESQLDWIARKLLSENLYVVVLPAAVLLLVRAFDERSVRDTVPAGLLLGVAAITRAPTLLYVPPAALIVAYGWRRAGASWRRAILAIGVLGLTTSAITALVPLRNYVVAGRPALVATNGGATLLLAHQPPEHIRLSGVDRDPLYDRLGLDRQTREVAEFARQDPLGYLATLIPLGLYAIGIPHGIEGQGTVAPDILALTLLYLAALVWLPGARTVRALLLHVFIAIHLAIMMTFLPYVYGYRQVLPMQLLMLAFGGGVLAHAWGLVQGRAEARRGVPIVEQGSA